MTGTALKIIAGLGNPGPEYLMTRHNAGFWFVDALAARLNGRFRSNAHFQGEVCRVQIEATEVALLKPSTYMNRSGLAVRALSDYMKVPSEQILVVHDELDLPVGEARFKSSGGHGGHNGLRDLVTHIGANFWRLRIGVGHPGDKALVIDYVLHRAPKPEEDKILANVAQALDALPVFIEQGAEHAMQRLHTTVSISPKRPPRAPR